MDFDSGYGPDGYLPLTMRDTSIRWYPGFADVEMPTVHLDARKAFADWCKRKGFSTEPELWYDKNGDPHIRSVSLVPKRSI